MKRSFLVLRTEIFVRKQKSLVNVQYTTVNPPPIRDLWFVSERIGPDFWLPVLLQTHWPEILAQEK